MKKLVFTLVILTINLILIGQAPQKMTYQCIIRNLNGSLITNQSIGIRISILQATSSRNVVYQETFSPNPQTNANGLLSIEIGGGTAVSGNFSTINWALGPHFLKTETDPAGGTNYTIVGTSQLLSVPYALYAKTAETLSTGGVPVYNTGEIGALTPKKGDEVFNLTENIYQIYNGSSWVSFASNCWPQPTNANAGVDQIISGSAKSTLLAGNSPLAGHGTGQWSIINGTGGVITNANNPSTIFTGTECTSYVLRWTISTSCSSSTDNVNITFNQTPTTANAGADQTLSDGTVATQLTANAPANEHGTGKWTIISGTGGSFVDDTNPTTIFSGIECTTYVLRWTISTACTSSSDDVNITFSRTPTTANAGADQTLTNGTTSTSLSANTPVAGHGSGQWLIISGVGGSITNANNPLTTFSGVLHEVYSLRWTISTNCSNSTDDVLIAFQQNGPGNEVSDVDGNTYSTVWIGNQLWMAGNLRSIRYSDGTEIPLVTTGPWGELGDDNTTKAYCWYNNNEALYKNTYGALYTWAATMNGATSSSNNPSGIQGVCPTGWHLPSDSEWKELEMYLGMSQSEADKTGLRGTNEGSKLAAEAGLWYDNVLESDVAFGTSGFLALPAGHRDHSNGAFYSLGYATYWWSATDIDGGGIAWNRGVAYDYTSVERGIFAFKSHGMSVRCVKD